jgi:hypothetical protein
MKKILTTLNGILKDPIGKAIFPVPTFWFLSGVQDIVGMHKRRYLKRELVGKIEQEEFKILKSSYFNFFLFFPILFARRIIHLLGLRIESENEINSPFVNSLVKGVFHLKHLYLNISLSPSGFSSSVLPKSENP